MINGIFKNGDLSTVRGGVQVLFIICNCMFKVDKNQERYTFII